MARRTRRSTRMFVHPPDEVVPASLGDSDVFGRHLAGPLLEEVQKHEEIPRAPVEDSIQVIPEVAPQLAELAFDLARVREAQVPTEHAKSTDLVVDCRLDLRRQPVNRFVNRLRPIRSPVVDDRPSHQAVSPCAAGSTGRVGSRPGLVGELLPPCDSLHRAWSILAATSAGQQLARPTRLARMTPATRTDDPGAGGGARSGSSGSWHASEIEHRRLRYGESIVAGEAAARRA